VNEIKFYEQGLNKLIMLKAESRGTQNAEGLRLKA